MSETRKVVVNGTEYEVELEHEGTTWKATVEGETFSIEMPDVETAAKPRRSGGRKKKKSGTVSANIPGKVVTVEVAEGQRDRRPSDSHLGSHEDAKRDSSPCFWNGERRPLL